jgi:hypothetical protein
MTKTNIESASHASHTPGPWENDRQTVYSVNGVHEQEIAEVYGNADGNAEANARLIAAAPELLEALKRITDAIEGTEPSQHVLDCLYKVAIKAIAKAEGRD